MKRAMQRMAEGHSCGRRVVGRGQGEGEKGQGAICVNKEAHQLTLRRARVEPRPRTKQERLREWGRLSWASCVCVWSARVRVACVCVWPVYVCGLCVCVCDCWEWSYRRGLPLAGEGREGKADQHRRRPHAHEVPAAAGGGARRERGREKEGEDGIDEQWGSQGGLMLLLPGSALPPLQPSLPTAGALSLSPSLSLSLSLWV